MSKKTEVTKVFKNGVTETYEVPEGMTDVAFIADRCADCIRKVAESHVRHAYAKGEDAYRAAVKEEVANQVSDIERYGMWVDETGVWYTAR